MREVKSGSDLSQTWPQQYGTMFWGVTILQQHIEVEMHQI